jgi:cobyrinic acid a,c-diamide synthase
VGPDFIDTQFHKAISSKESINLDTFIMSREEMRWIFNRYSTEKISIVEGAMGFYDGEDRGCSTYSISRDLKLPTVLVMDASGSYVTISAVLKGILEYKKDNRVRGVILNYISSKNHYNLIKNIIEREHPQIKVLGWIKKGLKTLKSTHLGLELQDLNRVESIAKEVLENIDIEMLKNITSTKELSDKKNSSYPFPPFKKFDMSISVINDKNFSFLYYDNLIFFREMFDEVILVDSTEDEEIAESSDMVYIPGGYVESEKAYERIKRSYKFKDSLIKHSKTKPIYAECGGLLYLSKKVDGNRMSGILDIEFELQKRFVRLGYYFNEKGVRGHSFHYTKPTSSTVKKGFDRLKKRFDSSYDDGEVGSWKKDKVFGTFLHTMFRVYPNLIESMLESRR